MVVRTFRRTEGRRERGLTYNDFLVDDMVSLVVAEGEEVGEDAHHNDGRDPDEDVGGHHGGRDADAVVSCQCHCAWYCWNPTLQMEFGMQRVVLD